MSKLIIPPAINSKRFTYVPETKALVAEESDLRGCSVWAKLYSDAADLGLAVVSDKTQATVVYVFALTEKDGEGEMVSWTFLPHTESIKNNPKCAGTKVVIFND